MDTARAFAIPGITSPMDFDLSHKLPAEVSPTQRRGLKRPMPQATRDNSQARKWAKRCGCSGPSCHAELFEDDECEELDFTVFESRLSQHAQQHCVSDSRGFDLARDRHRRDRASVSSESECESQGPESPPLLLHFLMMF